MCRSSILVFLTLLFSLPQLVGGEEEARARLIPIVAQLQGADYEGDQAAMQKGFDDLAPFLKNEFVASRVRYWRGFALWRKAINGFNDSIDKNELAEDLQLALAEFRAATESDPKFADAKIAIVSCLGYQAFLSRNEPARMQELFREHPLKPSTVCVRDGDSCKSNRSHISPDPSNQAMKRIATRLENHFL
jgi:hypothetical protein